jgi:AcrR family transcriptional regulator
MSAPARREQILDTATEIVAEQGFQAVSIQSVARRAGVTRPIVYEHFGGLQGLLESVVKREMSRALEQVSRTALPDLGAGEPVELLIESLASFLGAVAASPLTWRLVLIPPEGAPPSLRSRIVRGRAKVLASISAAVSPGSLPGELSADSELTARVLSASADEYARLMLEDPLRYPPERLLAHARSWLGHPAGAPGPNATDRSTGA